MSKCCDSFLDPENQQCIGETKPLRSPRSRVVHACSWVVEQPLCWLFQHISLPRASLSTAGWSFQGLNSSHCTAQGSVTWVDSPDNHVCSQTHTIVLLSLMNGEELNSQVWIGAKCYCYLCMLKTSWKHWENLNRVYLSASHTRAESRQKWPWQASR